MKGNKELALEDIQNEGLRMLGVIDRFCMENNIQYSLGYGSLIGAVRHKGFIPWDDDIDLIMTRPDYDRFVKLFNGSNTARDCHLKLYAPELGNSFFNITHICDMKRTRVRKYYQWTDEETGIWIDIFPVDCLPDDGGEAIRRQSNICFHTCGAKVPFSLEFSVKRHLKILAKRIIYGLYNREKEINKYKMLLKRLPAYGSTELVCNLASPYNNRDIHRKECFDHYTRISFEGMEVSIISKYDEYLRKIYGDYMVLPPEEKRVRGHSDNKYFWI